MKLAKPPFKCLILWQFLGVFHPKRGPFFSSKAGLDSNWRIQLGAVQFTAQGRPDLETGSRTWTSRKNQMAIDIVDLPFGEHTKSYGKSPFLMGKSTIPMAIFDCYVSSPEGTHER